MVIALAPFEFELVPIAIALLPSANAAVDALLPPIATVPEFIPPGGAVLVPARANLPTATAPVPLASPPLIAVSPPVPFATSPVGATTAQAPSENPNNAALNAVSLNKVFRRPSSEARTSPSAPSLLDLTRPFANSEVTTKEPMVRFHTTLKILFITISLGWIY